MTITDTHIYSRNVRKNFRLMNNINTLGLPYNPTSIMHYTSHQANATSGPTITCKPGVCNDEDLGSSTRPNRIDILKVKTFYGCYRPLPGNYIPACHLRT